MRWKISRPAMGNFSWLKRDNDSVISSASLSDTDKIKLKMREWQSSKLKFHIVIISIDKKNMMSKMCTEIFNLISCVVDTNTRFIGWKWKSATQTYLNTYR